MAKQQQLHQPGAGTRQVELAEVLHNQDSGPPSQKGPQAKSSAQNGMPLSGWQDNNGPLVKSPPRHSHRPTLGQGLLSAKYIMPAVSGATAFITMTAITSSTPLAMKKAGHSSDLATFTIEAHIGSRYIPSLVVADIVALLRFLVCHLVSSRMVVLRLLACLVFLMPMPHLICNRSLRYVKRDQGHSSDDLGQHRTPQQQQQQQQQQRQQPPLVEPHLHHHQCQRGEQVSLHQGLGEQLGSQELDHSCCSTSSSECHQPHMVVLVPDLQQEQQQQQQQQQEQQQEEAEADVPQQVRDTIPITSMMVLGSAILATSPGVLLAGDSLRYFMGGLVLAGSGWALNYVAASSLVTAAFAHDPVRLRKGQTMMDLFVLTPMAPAAATVSVILTHWGWHQFLYLYMGIILALFLWNLILHVCVVPSGIFNRAERPKS